MSGLPVSHLMLWVLVAVQGIVILVLIQKIVALYALVADENAGESATLPLGNRSPEFEALDLRLNQRVSSRNFSGATTVLLFLSPGCSLCQEMIRSLSAWWPTQLGNLVVICDGTNERCGALLESLHKETRILLDDTRRITIAHQARKLPTAVVLDSEGLVLAHRHVRHSGELRGIAARAREQRPPSPDPTQEARPPEVSGEEVNNVNSIAS